MIVGLCLTTGEQLIGTRENEEDYTFYTNLIRIIVTPQGQTGFLPMADLIESIVVGLDKIVYTFQPSKAIMTQYEEMIKEINSKIVTPDKSLIV